MFNKKKKNNKGFTLVELLVVIAIIGILAVVAVPSLFANINKSKAAKIESDFATVRTAVSSAYADGTALDSIVSKTMTELGVDGLTGKDVNYTLAAKKNASNVTTGIYLVAATSDTDIANRVIQDLGAGVASLKTEDTTNKTVNLLVLGN